MALKVMMLGGRRCGKTSALASMFDQIINGPIKQVFTMYDNTVYETKINIKGELEKQDTLIAKNLELQDYLSNAPTGTFLVDSGPTGCTWTYKLGLQIPGTTKKMAIDFLDCPGEFFISGFHDGDTNRFVEQSDVYIIMIDTPYLMECNNAISRGVNCTGDIHNFLSHINCQDSNTAKMVIFVPIKCEKWMKEGRIVDVIEKIKNSYAATITALTSFNFMDVAIIPILTAGNIEFMEMHEAYTVSTQNSQKQKKCAKMSDKLVRYADGKVQALRSGEILNMDPESVIVGNVTRPYSWFHISKNPSRGINGLYDPYNCEQLPLHILNFWFRKALANAHGGMFEWLWDIFGSITKTDMQQCLAKLGRMGSIKTGVDGIEYLHRASL